MNNPISIIPENNKEVRFKLFFETMYPRVLHFANKLLGCYETAEDLAQDIFIKLWEKPQYWDNEEASTSLIFVMTKNMVLNHLRHIKTTHKYYDYLNSLPQFSDDIHERLVANELEARLYREIEKMPKQRRTVFIMNKIECKSLGEIAEELKLSKRTIERHLFLSVSMLKKLKFA